jgi:hypothetical protein
MPTISSLPTRTYLKSRRLRGGRRTAECRVRGQQDSITKQHYGLVCPKALSEVCRHSLPPRRYSRFMTAAAQNVSVSFKSINGWPPHSGGRPVRRHFILSNVWGFLKSSVVVGALKDHLLSGLS